MSLKHRVINVLTLISIPFVLSGIGLLIRGYLSKDDFLIAILDIATPVIPLLLSYLMGLGFKLWHKEH